MRPGAAAAAKAGREKRTPGFRAAPGGAMFHPIHQRPAMPPRGNVPFFHTDPTPGDPKMSAMEPITPEPGWHSRWLIQAFTLLPRSPLALLVTLIGAVGAGLFSLLPVVPLIAAGIIPPGYYQILFVPLATTIFLFPVLISMALFFHADQGEGPGLPSVTEAFRSLVRRTALVATIFALLFYLPSAALEGSQDITWGSSNGPADNWQLRNILYGSVILTTVVWEHFIITCGWISLLMIPLSLGLRFGMQDVLAFEGLIQRRLLRVRLYLYFLALVIILVVSMAPLLCPLLFHYYLAVLYVAARELGGGIRQHGRQETQAFAGRIRPA